MATFIDTNLFDGYDLNYNSFMEMIDKNYLAQYTEKGINFNREISISNRNFYTCNYEFPVAKEISVKRKSIIDLTFALEDMKKLGVEKCILLDITACILNFDNSKIKEALHASGIAESYSIRMDARTFQPTMHFVAINADESKNKEFYDLVVHELQKISELPINSSFIKSTLKSLDFSEAIGDNQKNVKNELLNACYYDTMIDNPLVNYKEIYRKVTQECNNRVLCDVIKKYVLNNTITGLTVTIPKVGLLEKNEVDHEKELQEIQKKMTNKQLNTLIEKNEKFNAWTDRNTSSEILQSLQAITLDDITTEIAEYKICHTKIDSVNMYSTVITSESVNGVIMKFDLSHLTTDELLYINFFCDMIENGIATKNYTKQQVMKFVTGKANNLCATVSAFSNDEDYTNAYPIFNISYLAFEKDNEDVMRLISELLFFSKLEDIDIYGSQILKKIKRRIQYTNSNPLFLIRNRCMAYTSLKYKLLDHISGMDYYKFIINLEKQIYINKNNVIRAITDVCKKAFCKNRFTVLFAGSVKTQERYKILLQKFINDLAKESYQKVYYFIPKYERKEAIIIDSNVQFVCTNGSFIKNDLPLSEKSNIFVNILNDQLYLPKIRLKGGAYGVESAIYGDNYVVYTQNDRNYYDSLSIIENSHKFLDNLVSVTFKNVLERYKMIEYSEKVKTNSEIAEALKALLCYVNTTRKDLIQTLNEIKLTSVMDIEVYASYFKKINKSLNFIVAGSEKSIELHKEIFDKVIRLDYDTNI